MIMNGTPSAYSGWSSLMVMVAVAARCDGRDSSSASDGRAAADRGAARAIPAGEHAERRRSHAPALRARLPSALRDSFGASGELEHRQARAVDFELIGPVFGRREETAGAEVGDVVVLLDAVAADAEAADEFAVLRRAAWRRGRRRCRSDSRSAAAIPGCTDWRGRAGRAR